MKTHKNYASLVPIQISVYKDKLYIANDCVFPEDWTVEDILEKHKSRPYNPLIASTFFRAGFVESWGRGIEKINEACIKNGSPNPDFKIKKEDFMIKFFVTEDSKKDEGLKSVLQVIKDNPGIMAKDISKVLENRAIKTIERQIAVLTKRNLIEHRGSKKSGGYFSL